MPDIKAPASLPKFIRERVLDWSDERNAGDGIIITLAHGWAFDPSTDSDTACHVRGFPTVKEAAEGVRTRAEKCPCGRCHPDGFKAEETSKERLAAKAAAFVFDTRHDGEISRTELQYKSPTRYSAYGVFTDPDSGKVYRVELLHGHDRAIYAAVYHNGGRALPEAHRTDIREIAISAYCEAFGYERRIALGRGVVLSKVKPAAAPDAVEPVAKASPPTEPVRVTMIDCTPTWSGILPGLLAVLTDGNETGRAIARKELARMATFADSFVAAHKESK